MSDAEATPPSRSAMRCDTPDVHGALWIGALLLASGSIKAPFPADLEEIAARHFERFPPTAKA